ncbi:hypothetical protein LAZ67_8001073, partial [Cordylochernes scorpioides]
MGKREIRITQAPGAQETPTARGTGNKEIVWNFTPSHGPHFDGAWEIIIRYVKTLRESPAGRDAENCLNGGRGDNKQSPINCGSFVTRGHDIYARPHRNIYLAITSQKIRRQRPRAEREVNKNKHLNRTTEGYNNIIIPYIREVDNEISRILKKCKYNIWYSTGTKREFLTRNNIMKDNIGTSKPNNVIYGIKCTECDKIYVGETGRNLETRIKEHQQGLLERRALSKIGEHALFSGHRPDWNDIEIFHRNIKFKKERLFLEGWVSREFGKRTINTFEDIPQQYASFLNLKKLGAQSRSGDENKSRWILWADFSEALFTPVVHLLNTLFSVLVLLEPTYFCRLLREKICRSETIVIPSFSKLLLARRTVKRIARSSAWKALQPGWSRRRIGWCSWAGWTNAASTPELLFDPNVKIKGDFTSSRSLGSTKLIYYVGRCCPRGERHFPIFQKALYKTDQKTWTSQFLETLDDDWPANSVERSANFQDYGKRFLSVGMPFIKEL